jgi:hypothetical protein
MVNVTGRCWKDNRVVGEFSMGISDWVIFAFMPASCRGEVDTYCCVKIHSVGIKILYLRRIESML